MSGTVFVALFFTVVVLALIVFIGQHSWQAASERLEVAKTAVEILAIVGAAVWAYQKFVVTEEPSLRTNLQVSAELKTDETARLNDCVVEVSVNVRNAGKSMIDVLQVKQRVWLIPDSAFWRLNLTEVNDTSHFVDVEAHMRKRAYDQVEFQRNGALAYEYPPGSSAEYAFPWRLPRMRDSVVLVRFDFSVVGNKNGDFFFIWGKPCAPRSPMAASDSTT